METTDGRLEIIDAPQYQAILDGLKEPLAAIGLNLNDMVSLTVDLYGLRAHVYLLNENGKKYTVLGADGEKMVAESMVTYRFVDRAKVSA
jgi:hypothetical protein